MLVLQQFTGICTVLMGGGDRCGGGLRGAVGSQPKYRDYPHT